MTFRLLPGTATVVIWADALDPFYRDMEEGESFFTTAAEATLTLPPKSWPKPGDTKAITRWRYEDAIDPSGVRGKKITKLPAHVAG